MFACAQLLDVAAGCHLRHSADSSRGDVHTRRSGAVGQQDYRRKDSWSGRNAQVQTQGTVPTAVFMPDFQRRQPWGMGNASPKFTVGMAILPSPQYGWLTAWT